MLVVPPLRGLWKGLKSVERPGSSWTQPAQQSERGPHPADPQSGASNSHPPASEPDGLIAVPWVLRTNSPGESVPGFTSMM